MNNKIPEYLYGIQLYKNTNEEDLLYILAFIIDNCNYKCNYCYNIKPYTRVNLDLNKLFEYIQYIKFKYPNKYIQLELIGGEPTLHPGLLEFCEKAKTIYNIKIKIFTNLSAKIETYLKLLNNQNIVLIASWHSLLYDNVNQQYIDKVQQLINAGYKDQLEIRIMYEKDNSKNAIYVANTLVNIANQDIFDLSLMFNPEKQNNKLYDYSDEQMKEFNVFHQANAIRSNRKEFLVRYTDKSEELKTFTHMFCNKDYSFKHWLCNAGKNSLFIDYNGLVYPCVEYSCDIKNAIFNLYNKEQYFAYKFKPILCKLDYCSCDWDIIKKKVF